jgi:hypothetical protein
MRDYMRRRRDTSKSLTREGLTQGLTKNVPEQLPDFERKNDVIKVGKTSNLDVRPDVNPCLVRPYLSLQERGDKLEAMCTGCGQTGKFTIKTKPVWPKDFGDVLAEFSLPHKGGANAMTCRNCRPKIDAMLARSGFRLEEKRLLFS